MSLEQIDSIDAIAAEAAADPTLAPPPAAADPAAHEAKPVDFESDAAEIVELAYDSLTPLYPSLIPIYTPEIRFKLAKRTGGLMQKYNLSVGDILDKWAPEIGFAVVVLPLVGKTALAIKQDNAAARKAAEQTAPPVAETTMQPIIDKTEPGSLHTKL